MGSKHKTGGIFSANQVPGPGTYQPSHVNLDRAASYSLGGKYKIGTQMIIGTNGNHEKVVA